MSSNDIGGFYASLGLLVDKNSFEGGTKAIGGITTGLTKLAGTVRNVAIIMGTYALATSKIESEELKTAAAIGINVEKLNQWKTAAKLAGVNANAFVSSITQMEMTFQKMKDGQIDQALATKIGLLKIDFNDFMQMNATDRLKAVFDAAQAMSDQAHAAELVQSILGEAGLKFFGYLKESNETAGEILDKSKEINVTTGSDYANAFTFDKEISEAKARLEALSKSFGSDLAKSLTPTLEKFNKWLSEHGDELVEDLGKIAKAVGVIADSLAPATSAIANHVAQSVTQVAEGAGKIAQGDVLGGLATAAVGDSNKEEAEAIQSVFKIGSLGARFSTGARNFPGLGLLTHGADFLAYKLHGYTEEEYNAMWGPDGASQQAKKEKRRKNKQHVDDGIMRPDGTITQVAPDDWVFAAKNVSDLASALIPQGASYASGPVTYTITQTFNVNGTGGLMPQTIRQQAYNGTQSALQEAISQSERRLQLMPGAY